MLVDTHAWNVLWCGKLRVIGEGGGRHTERNQAGDSVQPSVRRTGSGLEVVGVLYIHETQDCRHHLGDRGQLPLHAGG